MDTRASASPKRLRPRRRVKPAYDDCVFSPESAMRIDAISIGVNPPHDVNVIIEVPVGGEPIKYEMDKDAGTLVVDRFLYTAMRYPGNYGFIPHTLSHDGDPCDVLVANTRAIPSSAVTPVTSSRRRPGPRPPGIKNKERPLLERPNDNPRRMVPPLP